MCADGVRYRCDEVTPPVANNVPANAVTRVSKRRDCNCKDNGAATLTVNNNVLAGNKPSPSSNSIVAVSAAAAKVVFVTLNSNACGDNLDNAKTSAGETEAEKRTVGAFVITDTVPANAARYGATTGKAFATTPPPKPAPPPQ